MAQVIFLKDNEIFLRPLAVADASDEYLSWMNDRETMQYLESRFVPQTRQGLEDYIRSAGASRSEILLGICDQGTSKHIGNIKLGPIDWIHRRADIGILIGSPDARGHGYGTAAIRLLAEHAFSVLNIRKLTAGCYESNLASRKAFEKAGFVVEATLRQHYYSAGTYTDCHLMARIREEKA